MLYIQLCSLILHMVKVYAGALHEQRLVWQRLLWMFLYIWNVFDGLEHDLVYHLHESSYILVCRKINGDIRFVSD